MRGDREHCRKGMREKNVEIRVVCDLLDRK